jgi:coproporphyrinogen III oxidase
MELSGGGRLEKKNWTMPFGHMAAVIIKGGSIEKAAICELVLENVAPPGTPPRKGSTVYQMEIFPTNPFHPMGHFNTEWSGDSSPVFSGNLDLFPAIKVTEDLQSVKSKMDSVALQFNKDPEKIRQGLSTQYNMEHFPFPLASSVGFKFGGLPEAEIDFFQTAYRTFFDCYIEIIRRSHGLPYKAEEERLKLERNGRWLQYIAFKDRAVKGGYALGIPADALMCLAYPPSAVF